MNEKICRHCNKTMGNSLNEDAVGFPIHKKCAAIEKKEIGQCAYCTNASNEGQGIWAYNKYTTKRVWICGPCFEIFKEAQK